MVNYAQWRTEADFRAMLANPKAREHIDGVESIGLPDVHLYTVGRTFHPA